MTSAKKLVGVVKVPAKDKGNEPQTTWEIMLRKKTIILFNQTTTDQEVIPPGDVWY